MTIFVRISNCPFKECSERERKTALGFGQYTDPQGNCLGEENKVVDFNTPNIPPDMNYLKVNAMAEYKADQVIELIKDKSINVVAVAIEGDITFVVKIFMFLREYDVKCYVPVFDENDFVQYRKL